jgi:hypothetical protein
MKLCCAGKSQLAGLHSSTSHVCEVTDNVLRCPTVQGWSQPLGTMQLVNVSAHALAWVSTGAGSRNEQT